MKSFQYKAIVIGVSFGGMYALASIVPELPADFPVPIVIVQHLSPNSDGFLFCHLNEKSQVRVKEAESGEIIQAGTVYLAPANYHLLLEDDLSLSLSAEDKVQYSRPSIDVLFESAAYAASSEIIGIVLTGANADGSNGLQMIKSAGGMTIVQDPETAEAAIMPRAAIAACQVDHIMGLAEIAPFLVIITAGKT